MRTFKDLASLMLYVFGGLWNNIDDGVQLCFSDTVTEFLMLDNEFSGGWIDHAYVFSTTDHIALVRSTMGYITCVQSYHEDNTQFAAGVITIGANDEFVFTVLNKG